MKQTERPTHPPRDRTGEDSTETGGPEGPSAAETGEFTDGAATSPAIAGGADTNATADFAPTPAVGGPGDDATAAPGQGETTAHGPAAPHGDATADLGRDADVRQDPDATDAADPDATGDYDPDATDALVLSPGVPAADTERTAESTGRRKDELPRITGYQILGVLGAGGMGIVYKARQARLDRLVALKMILAGAGARPGDLARFEAEARAVAAIDHPNIIKIFEIGEHDGLPYFSLEFLEGGSLSQRIGGQPQPVEDAARTVETLARAMDVAHRRGIVHRDIKPANVLLAADGTPKIADFGLVKRQEADSGQTRTGSILGSPSYMAPEQTTGAEKAGPAADQYALGATLYEMLTGRPPFRGSSIFDTIQMVRTAEPVPPSQLLPRMPRDLETICLKALQKDPARRYPDVAAMAEDLRHFLAGEPIVARPVSAPERLWRWCRRNSKVASLLAAVVFLVLAGLVGSTVAAFAFAAQNRALEQTNIQLTEAKTTAERAQKLAEEKERVAVAAGQEAVAENSRVVDEMREMITLLKDKWGMAPALQAVRKDVLERAIRILEVSAAAMTQLKDKIDWPAADEEKNWRSVALAHQNIAEVRLEANQIAETEKEFRTCNELLERVTNLNPSPENRLRLLRSYRQLGYFAQHHMGDSAEAMRRYQQSLEIARSLHEQEPDNDKYKNDLAETLGMMAIAEVYAGHIERGRALLDEARALRESCSATWNEDTSHRFAMAILYDQLCDLCLRTGDIEAARRYNERCAEVDRAILEVQPDNWSALYNLARSYNNSGMMLYPMGRDPAGAREFHRKALALIDRWVAADPNNAGVLVRLAATQYYEATCALKSGDRAGAMAGYGRCLAIREKLATDPKARIPQIDLMVVLARCGQHGKAAAIAGKLVARTPKNEMVYFQAACGFALSAGAVRDQQTPEALAIGGVLLATADAALYRSYADRAIDCLRQGKARGFADVVGLETDPDLEPIRDEPAFRSLIAEYRKPAAPKP